MLYCVCLFRQSVVIRAIDCVAGNAVVLSPVRLALSDAFASSGHVSCIM